jgi:hypothetical protein
MDVIRADITRALAAQGYPDVEIRTVLRPSVDHRNDERYRPAQAGRGPASLPEHDPAERRRSQAQRGVSAVCVARYRGAIAFRVDRVQITVAVPGMRRAVRSDQATMTAATVVTRKPRTKFHSLTVARGLSP